MEETIILGEPGDEGTATPEEGKPSTTPAGGDGDPDEGAETRKTSEEDDDEELLKEIRSKADLFDALHDPDKAELLAPMIAASLRKSGIDPASLFGTAQVKEAKTQEAAPVAIDLSDLKFVTEGEGKGFFDGTDQELVSVLTEKYGKALGAVMAKVAALEEELKGYKDPIERLKPVAEREQARADQRQVVTRYGEQVKARVLKEHGIKVNRQDLEDAFIKSPADAKTANGLYNAVVALKARKVQGKGPEFAGSTTGSERPHHQNQLDAVVANVVRDIRRQGG